MLYLIVGRGQRRSEDESEQAKIQQRQFALER
jgi:hypothetical protein